MFIFFQIQLNSVLNDLHVIVNKLALIQLMAWRLLGVDTMPLPVPFWLVPFNHRKCI